MENIESTIQSNIQEKEINKYNLDTIKNKIENMNTENHIEIAKILKNADIKLTENNNGIFINLTNLSNNILELLINYIEHIKNQDDILKIIETKKEKIENTFFKDNKD